MTWDEFKKLVDDELQKRGYDGGTVEVKVLDISSPDRLSLSRSVQIDVETQYGDPPFVDLSIW